MDRRGGVMSRIKQGPLYGIGGVTLLTVLLVLCLTMFAVLALSSAQADRRLSEKNARAVAAYYRADNQGVVLMSQAVKLWPAGGARPKAEALAQDLSAVFDAALEIRVEAAEERFLLSAAIPVQENQILRLSLYLGPPESPRRWEIRGWQVEPLLQNEDQAAFLPVWQP